MSRYNHRTHKTRAGLGGTAARMATRRDLRKTGRGALHAVNPPGTKVAKKMTAARGAYFHGSELTRAAQERSARRRARKENL